ncbi:MAG: transposase [Dokdonella sp.]
MFSLPRTGRPLLLSFAVAFSPRSFQRAMVLLIGAILAMGRRTVTNVLWTARSIAEGHFSSYHRLFSRASWSLWPLGKALSSAVLAWIPEDQPVPVAADDTVAQHRGPKVYGKARHRDAVRSSHSMTVWKWGHKWVVLAIVVQLPFTSRRWALPVLCALYRSKEQNRAEGRRHKTPAQLARQLMAALIRWFPRRKFVFLGDGGFGSHELARFFVRGRHRRHATLVSRFYPDAALYAPPTRSRIGRPRVKGRKLPSPRKVVAQRKKGKRRTVTWYGGATRRVQLISDVGQWYRIGQGLVPVRWVHVRDLDGTHRYDWVYSTDPTLSPPQIVSFFTGRWPIETTFQEVRHHLGFETTRQRAEKSVLRAGPCLLGLFSVVCLIYAEQASRSKASVHRTPWYLKGEPTFSDALAAVRRLFWEQCLFKQACFAGGVQKLPPPLRRMLLETVCHAA